MRVALVSIETDEVWALVDLRPDQDVTIATRFAVCEACGLLSAVPAGELPTMGTGGRPWLTCRRYCGSDQRSTVTLTPGATTAPGVGAVADPHPEP